MKKFFTGIIATLLLYICSCPNAFAQRNDYLLFRTLPAHFNKGLYDDVERILSNLEFLTSDTEEDAPLKNDFGDVSADKTKIHINSSNDGIVILFMCTLADVNAGQTFDYATNFTYLDYEPLKEMVAVFRATTYTPDELGLYWIVNNVSFDSMTVLLTAPEQKEYKGYSVVTPESTDRLVEDHPESRLAKKAQMYRWAETAPNIVGILRRK